MTKEELLEKLRAKIGKTSLSERTLSTYSENLLKYVSDDSVVDDIFLESHANILKSIEGQISHDISEGISDWKSKNTGVGNNKGENDDKDFGKILEMLEEIKGENSKLKERLDSAETKKSQSEYRELLKKAMQNKGAKNDYILSQTINQKEFDVSKSVDDVVEDFLSDYDSNFKSCFGSGASPRESGGDSGNSDNANKALDSFFERKANQGKFPTTNK